MAESERKKAHKEGPAPSKWRRIKARLGLGGSEPSAREKGPNGEEITTAPMAEPLPPPLPTDTPAAVFPSLLPAPSTEKETGDREKKGRSERRQMAKVVAARLTPSEYAAIAEKAARAGISLSAYARACLLGDPGLRAKRAPPVNRAALAQAIAALNRVGNNVNQIAHHLNAGGSPDRTRIAESSDQLDACLQAILGALGRAS